MITLTTLFDSAYRAKGLSLISSIQRHVPAHVTYVLCLDTPTWDYFTDTTIRGVASINLNEIETPELLTAKANRTRTEYYWTCASAFTWWCAERFNPSSLAYVDADCFLFGDPAPLYDEAAGCPVAITPHRYTPYQAARLKGAGVYNVGWTYFERDGFECLRDWRNKCVEWCKWEVTGDGRFADQGYLDCWPERYGAHVVYNLGVNLAPWNQEQYSYVMDGDRLIVSDGRRYDPLILYHFHGFEGVGRRTGYPLHPMVAEHVYKPYEVEYARWLG